MTGIKRKREEYGEIIELREKGTKMIKINYTHEEVAKMYVLIWFVLILCLHIKLIQTHLLPIQGSLRSL